LAVLGLGLRRRCRRPHATFRSAPKTTTKKRRRRTTTKKTKKKEDKGDVVALPVILFSGPLQSVLLKPG